MVGAWAGTRAIWRTLIAVAVLVGLVALPVPVAAAEGTVQTLPGATLTAVVADLDGDGAREIVRLIDSTGPGFEVEAWGLEAHELVPVGAADLHALIPDPTVGPAAAAETAGLMLWRRDGTDRVLALTASTDAQNPFESTCCMTIAEVRRSPSGIRLQPMLTGDDAAQSVVALDLDGDGTDELVTERFSFGEEDHQPSSQMGLLGWNGGRFVPLAELSRDGPGIGFIAGESDGYPGDEILFGPSENGWLERLSWVDGELTTDDTWLKARDPYDAHPAGFIGGDIVLVRQSGIALLDWPRGEEARRQQSLQLEAEFPTVAVIGSGEEAVLLVQDQGGAFGMERTLLRAYDSSLEPLGEVQMSSDLAPLWAVLDSLSQRGGLALDGSIFPYIGPLPVGLIEGRPAYFMAGTVLQPDGRGGIEARPATPMVGTQPLGSVGPDDGWVATLDAAFLGGRGASLYGPLGSWGSGRLSVLPVASVLDPTPADVSVELRDAVEVASTAEHVTLLAGPQGFTATISAPPGSVVVEIDGTRVSDMTVADEPVAVEVGPPRNRDADENQEVERTIIVMTPDGRARVLNWEATVLREPPSLDAIASTDAFSLTATLRGEAGPGTTVIVDGRQVALDAEGRFEAEADAPIWPRDVVVTARDPFGHERTQRIQVVGFLDYRGLPWVPILGLATVVAGVVLFLRTPRRREAATMTWTDATLEEIDGD